MGTEKAIALPNIVSVTILGVLGGFIPLLQPLLLGALAEAGRIDASNIGWVAMAEGLAAAAGTGFASAALKPVRLRLALVLALTVALAMNVLTMQATGVLPLVVIRLCHGVACGILIWIFVTMLTRIPGPARLLAIFATAMSSSALLFAYILSTLLLPRYGATSGYALIAILDALGLLLLPIFPRGFALVAGGKGPGLPGGRGLVALLAVFCHFAGLLAIWVYAQPIGVILGNSIATSRLAISAAIAAQIVGGLSATIFAPRLRALPTLISCIGAAAVAVGIILLGGGAGLIAGLTLIGFTWMFGGSLHMAFLLQADPSTRAGLQMSTAQSLGAAAGPAMAAVTANVAGTTSVLMVGAALFGAAIILAFASRGEQAGLVREQC